MLPTDDKARKALPLFTYLMEYFPDSFVEECRVAVIGNIQHNPGQPIHWARQKSTDQLNTALRHMMDHKRGAIFDVDGTYHLAKAIWRLKAELQLTIERINDARRKSESTSDRIAETARSLQAHAGTKWIRRASTRLPRVQSRKIRRGRVQSTRR